MPEIQTNMTEEEFEKSSSKFAEVGEHLSECIDCDWKTPGKSVFFQFRIIAPGPDEGKENEISVGINPEAAWKLKEILNSLGVENGTVNGKVSFNTEDCIGKQFITVWSEYKDSRTPEEGGKGTVYTKPDSTKPVQELPF